MASLGADPEIDEAWDQRRAIADTALGCRKERLRGTETRTSLLDCLTVAVETKSATMSDSVRKSLLWDIRKNLLNLPARELFQIAKQISPLPDKDQSLLEEEDPEGCLEYINAFMYSKPLLESEDRGMVDLLVLKDIVDKVTQLQNTTIAGKPDVDVNVNIDPDNPPPAQINMAVNTSEGSTTATASSTPDIPNQELQRILLSYKGLSEQLMQCVNSSPPHVVPPQITATRAKAFMEAREED